MNKTSIEWCCRPETRGADGARTWNPIRAKRIYAHKDSDLKPGTFCTRISPGCTNCYASAINKRFGNGLDYTVPNLEKIEFYLDERILQEPLKTKKPCTIFLGDMYDGWHEAIGDPLIDKVMAVVALCDWHIFQGLTKRAERLLLYFSDRDTPYRIQRQIDCIVVDQEMSGVQERYVPIPHYEGHYEISNYGAIRSKTGRPLLPRNDGKGYLTVALSKQAIVTNCFVHRLVLAAFVGESDDETRHRNGIGTDNRIANLLYGTASANAGDRSRHGTAGRWMKTEAPLTDAEVLEIRRRRETGERLKSIEADTGVDRRKVSQIATGKTYKTADLGWPLPNFWLGVSVESQKYADERIPLLLQTPAALRFLSVEPQLEAVDLTNLPLGTTSPIGFQFVDSLRGWCSDRANKCGAGQQGTKIDWLICGGESGPKARPFNLAWAESLREQCKAAEVAFFMKQVGSRPIWPERDIALILPGDRKGGNITTWPESLRVREFPHYNVTMQKCEPSSTPE